MRFRILLNTRHREVYDSMTETAAEVSTEIIFLRLPRLHPGISMTTIVGGRSPRRQKIMDHAPWLRGTFPFQNGWNERFRAYRGWKFRISSIPAIA